MIGHRDKDHRDAVGQGNHNQYQINWSIIKMVVTDNNQQGQTEASNFIIISQKDKAAYLQLTLSKFKFDVI